MNSGCLGIHSRADESGAGGAGETGETSMSGGGPERLWTRVRKDTQIVLIYFTDRSFLYWTKHGGRVTTKLRWDLVQRSDGLKPLPT